MGRLQAILSLTLIVGPVLAGLAFDHLGVPAPYWIGALLAALALFAAVAALQEHRSVLAGRSFAKRLSSEPGAPHKPGE
jgi:MFS transporter, DHA1 family, tetracycline resistance protein